MMFQCVQSYVYDVFFCKYAGTPEIYPYVHTLSLHTALPIFSEKPCGPLLSCPASPAGSTLAIAVNPRMTSGSTATASIASLTSRASIFLPTYSRSEEHTSELQSLMRKSYAVFCLQKKTTN